MKHVAVSLDTAVCNIESLDTIKSKYKQYFKEEKDNLLPFIIDTLRMSGDFIAYRQGFHSFVSTDNIPKQNYRDRIVECTIPAGSYYVESGNEIVSDQLIINKIINL